VNFLRIGAISQVQTARRCLSAFLSFFQHFIAKNHNNEQEKCQDNHRIKLFGEKDKEHIDIGIEKNVPKSLIVIRPH
jgi:hypothetical protein